MVDFPAPCIPVTQYPRPIGQPEPEVIPVEKRRRRLLLQRRLSGRGTPRLARMISAQRVSTILFSTRILRKRVGLGFQLLIPPLVECTNNRFQIDELNMGETLKQFEAERQLFEARYQGEGGCGGCQVPIHLAFSDKIDIFLGTMA